MNLLDIVGPVMVGPSSSHTAGAVKIGYVSRKLIGCDILSAKILFHGSFAATGKGHGTDRAIVAGLMGMSVDDIRIPNSLDEAKKVGMNIEFGSVDLGDFHPNSVKIQLIGANGSRLEMVACSIGGGRIEVTEINGTKVSFSGDCATLIVHNQDKPGLVTEVTSMLAEHKVNIATMQLYRSGRNGSAVMVIECDQEVSQRSIDWLEQQDGIIDVTYLSME